MDPLRQYSETYGTRLSKMYLNTRMKYINHEYIIYYNLYHRLCNKSNRSCLNRVFKTLKIKKINMEIQFVFFINLLILDFISYSKIFLIFGTFDYI